MRRFFSTAISAPLRAAYTSSASAAQKQGVKSNPGFMEIGKTNPHPRIGLSQHKEILLNKQASKDDIAKNAAAMKGVSPGYGS